MFIQEPKQQDSIRPSFVVYFSVELQEVPLLHTMPDISSHDSSLTSKSSGVAPLGNVNMLNGTSKSICVSFCVYVMLIVP